MYSQLYICIIIEQTNYSLRFRLDFCTHFIFMIVFSIFPPWMCLLWCGESADKENKIFFYFIVHLTILIVCLVLFSWGLCLLVALCWFVCVCVWIVPQIRTPTSLISCFAITLSTDNSDVASNLKTQREEEGDEEEGEEEEEDEEEGEEEEDEDFILWTLLIPVTALFNPQLHTHTQTDTHHMGWLFWARCPPSHPHYYTAANPVSQIPAPWTPQRKSYWCCASLHTL